MTGKELDYIRDGVEDLKRDLAIHDAKVDSNIALISQSQIRLANAVEKIGDATIAIKGLAEKISTNGSNGKNFMLDRKTLIWLLGLALGGSAVMGGGQEAVHRLFHIIMEPEVHGPVEPGH